MLESVATGVIVALITTLANFFLIAPFRRGQARQDSRLDTLASRVVELEDVRLAGVVKTQDMQHSEFQRLRAEITMSIDKITRTVEAFVCRMESGLDEGRKGRAAIHERINRDSLAKSEFNARMDQLNQTIGRLEKSFTEAILVARDAERKVAHLEGVLEGKS